MIRFFKIYLVIFILPLLFLFSCSVALNGISQKISITTKNNTDKDSLDNKNRFSAIEKGTVNLSLSPSVVTIFSIKSPNTQFNGGGIFGIAGGLDFFYNNNNYMSIDVGTGTSRVGIVDHFGPGYIERGSTIFASIRNNNLIGRFDLGYGINLSQLTYAEIPNDTSLLKRSYKNTGFGLSLSALYRLKDHFGIGVLYQPNLVNINSKSTLRYQHYLSLNLTWKLQLRKKK